MATVAELFEIIDKDYLDNRATPPLWDDNFKFRAINEAVNQACNRSDLIFDDSTAGVCEITLVNGQETYNLSQLITRIEHISFDGIKCNHLSKHEIELATPDWRTLTGMTGKIVNYIIRGKTIRFSPAPNADDAGKKVYLEVYRLPLTKLTASTQSPEIATEFHKQLIYWVLHEAYKKQDADAFNQEKSDYYLDRFAEIFGDYISAEVRLNNLEQRSSLNLRVHAYDSSKLLSEEDDWD